MPDVRFLTEASFIIGVGVGALAFAPVWWGIGRWRKSEADAPHPPIVAYGRSLSAKWDKEMTWKNSNRARFVGANLGLSSTRPTTQRGSLLSVGAAQTERWHTITQTKLSKPGTAAPRRKMWRIITNHLETLLRNEYGANGERIPRAGVSLTYSLLARYGIAGKERCHADWLRDVVAERYGWQHPTTREVYLSRAKALAFLRGRDAGKEWD